MKVVVLDGNVGPWLQADPRLAAAGVELDLVPTTEAAAAALRGADAYVGIYFPEGLAAATGPRFRLLQVTAAGTDHIDLAAVPAAATVCNAYGHGPSIAEHVLMVTLALRRRLLWRDAELRAGRWRSRLVDPASPRFTTLRGAALGVVGYGHVGRAIAALAGGMGMRVAAVTRSGGTGSTPPPLSWHGETSQVGRLAEESDVLVLACPLTPQTRGLVGIDVLDRLGPDGLLVNVARGPVVDEAALYAALRERRISGAALDVWDVPAGTAPVSTLPFAERDDVILTPHFSATADDTYRDRATEVADNLLRLLRSEPLDHVVR